jgi:hypothetical protein
MAIHCIIAFHTHCKIEALLILWHAAAAGIKRIVYQPKIFGIRSLFVSFRLVWHRIVDTEKITAITYSSIILLANNCGRFPTQLSPPPGMCPPSQPKWTARSYINMFRWSVIVCMRVCANVSMRMCACESLYANVCIQMSVCKCVYANVCMRMCVCECVYANVCMRTSICQCLHANTCMRTHVCECVFVCVWSVCVCECRYVCVCASVCVCYR